MYIVIDGELHGTGLRDYYNGGYIDPRDLDLSISLREQLSNWLIKYENEHYSGFTHELVIKELDKEGLEIARLVKQELKDNKISYYSAAKLTTTPV